MSVNAQEYKKAGTRPPFVIRLQCPTVPVAFHS